MAKCNVCGKKGLFLRVNSSGRCKECEAQFQEEEYRKKKQKIEFEQSCLERQEKEGLFPISLHSYVVTDIETSGLDYNISSIIEISAIKVLNGRVIERYSSLIHSERTLSQQIIELTGITTDMVRSCQKSLESVMEEYREFIGNYPLIGHNINKFDILFIDKAYKTVFGTSIKNKCVDTLSLSREYIRDSKNYKLQTLAKHLNLSVSCAHRALSDCETTLELYKAISGIAEEKRAKHDRIKAEMDTPDSDDGRIVRLVRDILKDADCSYIRYKKDGKYLRFKCFYEIFRIKTSGRIKNYIVFAYKFEQELLNQITLRTAPATSNEGGGKIRIFFDSSEEFMQLADIIRRVYEEQKQEVEKYIDDERKRKDSYSEGFLTITFEGGDSNSRYEKSVKEYMEDTELFKL